MAAISTTLAAALLSALFLGEASPKAPVGWRTDGTGHYTGVTPPTEWGESTNIRWKIKLPGPSQGSPILVGEHLFVVSDPAELLCVNAADGEILWRRSSALEDLYGAAKAKQIKADYDRLRTARHKLEDALRRAKGDPEKQSEIKQQLAAAHKEQAELTKRFPPPPSYTGGDTTNSAATPCSDGKHVYALFANGVVCAYTVTGERRWHKYIEAPTITFGHASSPALAEGKLIVHLNDLFALDAATGEISWQVPLPARHASPIITRVGQTSVVISPAGAVIRLADGKVLAKDGVLSASECTPVLAGGVLYAVPGGAQAVRLIPAGQDGVKVQKLWQKRAAGGRRTPSPVLHDGLLYAVNTDGLLEVFEAATGEPLYKERLEVGSVYSSVTAAGDYLYLSGTRGTTVVLTPGREYREVGRNKLEGFGSSPVFSGRRMFVRTRQHLYCIGR
jgi:outer membrane protein assembly factor BamB